MKHLDETFTAPRNMEEDIPKILKQIGYPFNLTKSHMLAFSSPHTWPTILGALDWLREVIEVFSYLLLSQKPCHTNDSKIKT